MRMRLSRAEGAPPIYAQVVALLRRRIRDGELGPETKLPKELDLARRLGVSRIPARHALAILQREGLILRRHGRGMFVAEKVGKPEVLRLTGIIGWSAVSTEHRLLSVIARQLSVAVGAPVLYVETRIWRKNGVPLMYSQTYYRGDRSTYSIEDAPIFKKLLGR